MDELLLLLRTITTSLVDDGNLISIRTEQKEDCTFIYVSTNKRQTGQLIGKNGKIGDAVRVIAKAHATRAGLGKIYIDFSPGRIK